MISQHKLVNCAYTTDSEGSQPCEIYDNTGNADDKYAYRITDNKLVEDASLTRYTFAIITDFLFSIETDNNKHKDVITLANNIYLDAARSISDPYDKVQYNEIAFTPKVGEYATITDARTTIDVVWNDFKANVLPYNPYATTSPVEVDQSVIFLPPYAKFSKYGDWDNKTIYYYIYGSSGSGSADSPLSTTVEYTLNFDADKAEYADTKNSNIIATSLIHWQNSTARTIHDDAKADLNSLKATVLQSQYIQAEPTKPSDFTARSYFILEPPDEVSYKKQFFSIPDDNLVEVSSKLIRLVAYIGDNFNLYKTADISKYIENFSKLFYDVEEHTYKVKTTDNTFSDELPRKLLEELELNPADKSTQYTLTANTYQAYKVYSSKDLYQSFNRLNNKGLNANRQYSAEDTDSEAEPSDVDIDSAKSNAEYIAKNLSSLMTPAEYYSENSVSTIVDPLYDKVETKSSFTGVPSYFWVETLKNWCIIKAVRKTIDPRYAEVYYDKTVTFKSGAKKTKENFLRRSWSLYVWDGKGGWVNFNRICQIATKVDNKPVSVYELGSRKDIANKVSYETQFYDLSRFTYISNFRADAATTSTENWPTEIHHTEPNWLVARGIVLTNDRHYSILDSTSCQAIRQSRVYGYLHSSNTKSTNDWQVMLYSYVTGCPMIWRLPSGELFLSCDWQLDGPYDKANERRSTAAETDAEEFFNKAARAFFGDGANKTIEQDWRNFTEIDSVEEYASAFLTNDNDDTLLAGKTAFGTVTEYVDRATIRVAANRSRVNGTTETANINTIIRW